MERKIGKTEKDFLEAKNKTLAIADRLIRKYPWILSFRFKGDSDYHLFRKREDMRKIAEEGEEVSFGLNMIMTYLDEKNKERETEVVLRHKDKPFYNIHFKALADNPTKDDLIKQWKDTWIILFSGGTVETPKAVIVAKFGEYPLECFVNASHKGHPGRWKLEFTRFLKWIPFGIIDIFGNDPIKEQFEKIRKQRV